eukprot:TRINITY_DN1119_c0_g1_i1.p1 TRINITY_DN1119_c0_g1~~TRINITY_DN1119_c0_g1_i1.p1  ORF type:complete len:129 (-),score=19.76 TRINITY_DN1119_c0_g1_i1:161-547(-)
MDRKGVSQHLYSKLWDTAGEERFRTITSSYYRGAHGIIVVYDMTNPQSFNNIKKWLQEIERYASNDVIIFLFGNKCDLEGERKVSSSDGKDFANQHNLYFLETSAKNSSNVTEAFLKMARSVKEQLEG